MKRRSVRGASTVSAAQPINHINRQIPPEAHTPMYIWHKFWGRKTWNVVAEYIKAYCPKGGIVLDPFAGSGVVAMEAVKAGRRAIICDLMPIATEIARLTLKPVDLNNLRQAFTRVETRVKERILSLYTTRCRKCRYEFPFDCAVWDRGECIEIRYGSCPRCGDRREKDCGPNKFDRSILEAIESRRITSWYPDNRLYYPDGNPFKEKQRYETLGDLFTKRNLLALSWLMEAIEEEPHREDKDLLKIAFTSMVHLCSRMRPEDKPGRRPFSGAGWTQHSYWSAQHFLEMNVWNIFERAVVGRQGLCNAKGESNTYFKDVRIARNIDDLFENRADVYIFSGDSVDFMKALVERYNTCIDYIFTDPPYDASVQYGELAYLWVAWLKKDEGYIEKMLAKEVVRNERQHKNFEVYQSLLGNALRQMYNVLKPNAYLTLTFHNPTFKVRNATIYSGVVAGFDFEKIHHQPLGQVSAKAMLQPFGSAQGDFYLRFHKKSSPGLAIKPEEIDELRFEKVVLETAKRVVAERGEPTPYTILINAIDPELARNGYFSELKSGLDVRTVLEKRVGQEFVLLPVRIGGVAGKAWWFKNPSKIPHLKSVPLSERVEQTVLRKLQERGRVTFTEMWAAISDAFPNSLTTDSTSIREALSSYARQVGRGEWLLKDDYRDENVRRAHTKMIVVLAEIGKEKGYEIWIGRREQGDRLAEGFPNRRGELRQFMTKHSLKDLKDVSYAKDAELMDVLWLQKNQVAAAFEVEITTSMTEALKRGSTLSPEAPKYLVIPEEREDQLSRKLESPLFRESFKNDSWKTIYAEALAAAFVKQGGSVDIDSIVDKRATGRKRSGRGDKKQLLLFSDETE